MTQNTSPPRTARTLTVMSAISGGGRATSGAGAGDSGRLVGASWCRVLTANDAGTGYVDDEKPELAAAVESSNRGAGIGRAFGDHGLLTVDFYGASDRANCIAIQPDDQRILVAGSPSSGARLAMIRLLPSEDGTPSWP
jgi:hypothetical protein